MANIEDVSHLLEVMKQLRDPFEGCAWDLEQDHDSLIPYLCLLYTSDAADEV